MDGLASKGRMGKGKEAAAKIVARMFADRTYTHMKHLSTGNYSEHIALDEFYGCVVDLADKFAETAQGKFGKLNVPVVKVSTGMNAADELEMCIEEILKASEVCGNRALNAIVDEIEVLYRSTIYKLRELK